MNKTGIEYLDYTWNPIAMRCTPISEGCQNCWHLRLANRLSKNPVIPIEKRNAYAGGIPYLDEKELNAPLLLKKSAIIGVQFMGDIGHQDITVENIRDIFHVMDLARQHTYLLLTKRPNILLRFIKLDRIDVVKDFHHVWIGVTIENQARADERIPILLSIPGAKHFVSIEPMLGEISLAGFDGRIYRPWLDTIAWKAAFDWVICGCESGPKRRPTNKNHIRALKDQCVEANVPFFLKQREIDGKVVSMPELDGQKWDEMP